MTLTRHIRTETERVADFFGRKAFKLPFSIHGETMPMQGPKSAAVPSNGTTFSCTSLFQSSIFRRNL
jgi:hypothetical protein